MPLTPVSGPLSQPPFSTLAAAIAAHASAQPHAVALYFEGDTICYGQLWQRVVSATPALQALGVTNGKRVAYLGLNNPAELVLFIALSRLGAIFTPLNYRLAAAELAAICEQAGVTLLVCDDLYFAVGERLKVAVALGFPICHATLFDNSDQLGESKSEGFGPRHHTDTPALLVYTSGTTGKPKGAVHTQAGLVANCMLSADAHGLTAVDHVLTALPLFHVGGLCIQTIPALYVGASLTLHPRFDASAWLRDVARRRPSMSLLVPATMRAILASPDFASTDLASLRLISAGSSTIAAALINGFHASGVPVCQVYGATETGPVSIYLKRVDAVRCSGSAGKPGPGVRVRLVNALGRDTPDGEVGELYISGPNVMQCYWQELHNAAFADGWFRTGDLALRDADGFYWVVGRLKDMIISGGENIYPAEIENLLMGCSSIAECAVVGQADDHWGEVAVAVVVPQPGSTLTAASVMALFDNKLARFKQPKKIVFASCLPKTATGKVQKALLAEQLTGRQGVVLKN